MKEGLAGGEENKENKEEVLKEVITVGTMEGYKEENEAEVREEVEMVEEGEAHSQGEMEVRTVGSVG